MRTLSTAGMLLLGVAVWCGGDFARAQFEPPDGTLPMEDTGTIEDADGNVLKIRDSKNDIWLMHLTDDAYVSVEGEAEASYLKPGMLVELWGTIDKKGMLEDEIDEIVILSASAKANMGLFDEDDTSPQAKPIRNPGTGSFFIRGKIATCKNGELAVTAGGRKVTGSLMEDVHIMVFSDDSDLAQTGDTVTVKAWYYENAKPMTVINRAGQAMVEEVTITLAEPLSGVKKAASKNTPKKAGGR